MDLEKEKLLKTNVADYYPTYFSVRILNTLKCAEVKTLDDLVKYNRRDFLKFKNFGQDSFNRVEKFLEEKGLKEK